MIAREPPVGETAVDGAGVAGETAVVELAGGDAVLELLPDFAAASAAFFAASAAFFSQSFCFEGESPAHAAVEELDAVTGVTTPTRGRVGLVDGADIDGTNGTVGGGTTTVGVGAGAGVATDSALAGLVLTVPPEVAGTSAFWPAGETLVDVWTTEGV